MQKYVLCFIAILLLATSKVSAQGAFSENAKKYILQYSALAIVEQRQNGVPASVTLGQGILETEAGTSELMTNANNHFGIKCNNGWQGETYTYTDDAPDECFKKYKCAEDSYRDHSEHLRKNGRYSRLFTLKLTDYRGWATGLKKAGYATNPQYAQRLIDIIETYGLEEYTNTALDTSIIIKTGCTTAVVAATSRDVASPVKKTVETDTIKNKTAAPARTGSQRIVITHDRHTVQEGETVSTIAQMEGVDQKQLMAFNFLYPNEEPVPGSVLELQKTARRKPDVVISAIPAHKENAIVGAGDKTSGGSDDYVTINRTKTGSSAAPAAAGRQTTPAENKQAVGTAGQPVQAKPKYTRPSAARPAAPEGESDPQKDRQLAGLKAELDKVVYADDSKLMAANAPSRGAVPQIKTEAQSAAGTNDKFYTVKKGETAFSVAKKNNITVAQLMKWNNMEASGIKAGQNLRIKE